MLAFAALYKKCFDLRTHEYTYELCLFDKVVQKGGVNGVGAYIDVGRFTRFGKRGVVDKDVDVNAGNVGKGGEPVVMMFENGQGCWNGPARSIEVT